jgi:PAS domain S-box-containing protein
MAPDREPGQETAPMIEERFRDIFENLAIGIFRTRPDGSIAYVNPAMTRVFGFSSPGEMIVDLTDIGRQAYVDPRQRERVVATAVRDGRIDSAEVVMRRKDGQEFPASISLRVVRDEQDEILYFEGSLEDISERKRIEDALRRSEQKYRELVENANSIILRWTRDGRIAFLNEFGLRFFGYAEEEIAARHVVGTIVPDTESTGRDLRPLMDEICADPKKFEHNVNENVCRDGRPVWIDWTNKVVLDEAGQVKEILSIGSDITERVKAQEELVKYREHLEELVETRTAELAEARDRAEAADRIKSAFLATMSHELRTPLNSIIGFTGILLQGLVGPLNEEQKKQLGMVRDSSNHLLNLINDVLDISKIEAGQLLVTQESFDLRGTIQKAVRTALPLAGRKGLAIDVEVAPDIGVIISDQRRVEQILLNLLSNAVKFTDTGVIRIGCALSGGNAVIRVIDHGIGIRSEDMDSLFKPFSQVDTGITRRYEGTGLGLSICKKLVELLGGTIGVESEWGKGSVFCVALPYGRSTT